MQGHAEYIDYRQHCTIPKLLQFVHEQLILLLSIVECTDLSQFHKMYGFSSRTYNNKLER